jgi:hypothetical protein
VTQPKPSSARDPAQENDPPAASQPAAPLPFTPSKGGAPQSAARESAPQTPSGQPPSQPIQFTPARTPAPTPQTPPSAPQPPAAPPAAQTPIVVKPKRRISRFVMLVVIPLASLALGFSWWLSSGRYVSTDNAYVGADKSLITPQVTGAIVAVHVVEGQKVKVGDPLFDIDPKPYEIALALAKGKLEAAKVEFANLQSTYASNVDQIKMGQDAVRVRQADFDRKNDLAISRSGTAADRDTSMANLIQAKQILEFVKWQQATVTVKLSGRRRRAQSAQHQGARANRRRCDAGARDRARTRGGGRTAGVCGRRQYRPVGRRQSEGIGLNLCPRRPARQGER